MGAGRDRPHPDHLAVDLQFPLHGEKPDEAVEIENVAVAVGPFDGVPEGEDRFGADCDDAA